MSNRKMIQVDRLGNPVLVGGKEIIRLMDDRQAKKLLGWRSGWAEYIKPGTPKETRDEAPVATVTAKKGK